jgi:hypothetical protein
MDQQRSMPRAGLSKQCGTRWDDDRNNDTHKLLNKADPIIIASIAFAMVVRIYCAILESPLLKGFGRRDHANGTTLGAEATAAIRQLPDRPDPLLFVGG